MAGGIELNLETANLTELGEALKRLFADKGERARMVAEAMKKVVPVVTNKLRSLTPVGPTGNLLAAANGKVVEYPSSGNAVGIVGYNQAGKGRSRSAAGGRVRRGNDRAFHQWWLEDGTDERVVSKFSNTPYQRKGHTRRTKSGTAVSVRPHQVSGQNAYIASSFNRLGPFKTRPTPRPPRGQSGQRVQTDPQYPGAFFKKSASPIRIPAMTPGGTRGRPPLATAWAQTESTVAEILQRELRAAIEAKLNTVTAEAA